MYHAFEVGSAIKLPERITKLYDSNIILVIAVYLTLLDHPQWGGLKF